MASKTVAVILTGFFNVGEGKRPTQDWLQELKALSASEKRELAELVCAVTGDEIK